MNPPNIVDNTPIVPEQNASDLKSEDSSADECDTLICHTAGHSGPPWTDYKKIVNAYVKGHSKALENLLHKNKDNLDPEDLEEIINYAYSIQDKSESNYDYDTLEEYDSSDYHADDDSDDDNNDLPKTNSEMSKIIILKLKQFSEQQKPKPVDALRQKVSMTHGYQQLAQKEDLLPDSLPPTAAQQNATSLNYPKKGKIRNRQSSK
jgi:hypothetical protein